MYTSTVTRVTQDYAAAFNSHDLNKFISFYASDSSVEDVGLNKSYQGVDQIRKSWSNMFNAFPDARMDIKNEIHSGDWSAVEWVIAGTNKGILPAYENNPEMPATNKKINLKGCSLVQWRQDKIIMEHDYWNMGSMLNQLGLMPSISSKAASTSGKPPM